MRPGGANSEHVLDDHLHDLFPVELVVIEEKGMSNSYIHLSVTADSHEQELWRADKQIRQKAHDQHPCTASPSLLRSVAD